ncbi:MAG: UvrD-helicase domain-containing protein, partial [Nitriliruptoraceae bacterium]
MTAPDPPTLGTPVVFGETDPLPTGTVLLEASAGTGKTHTITTLVLRLIAEEDVRIDELVVVTFTRAAAAELRGRVRARLHQATVLLERLAAGVVDHAEVQALDPVVGHLAEQFDVEVPLRRLRVARERFDEGTIDTIHGFCQRVLQQSGAQLGVDPTSELEEDVHDLVRSVVDDLLVRELRSASVDWCRAVNAAVPGRDLAGSLAGAVGQLAARPHLRVHPDDDRTAVQVWDDTCTAFREAWRDESERVIEWIDRTQQARGFGSKRTYLPATVATARAELDAWCDGPLPALGASIPSEAALKAMSRSEVQRCLEDPAAIPNGLTILDLAGELARVHTRAATAFVRRLTRDAVDELERRTRDAGLWTFDDLLLGLDRALRDASRREIVVEAMRARFSAALIDEFQDTDPIQWHIFSTLFGGRDGRLFLIGDPKQAIYAFRGADIRTYLDAVADTATADRRTLDTNHRSDQPYLDAVERLFHRDDLEPDGAFAVPDIRFRQVRATRDHDDSGIDLPDGPRPALDIRVLPRTLFDVDDAAPLALGRLRPALPGHVAAEIDAFLRSGTRIRTPGQDSGDVEGDNGADDESRRRPVEAGDVAVLTRTRRQAAQVQDALRARGIPAVIGADDSVLDTPEADALERLLAAMLAPTDDRTVRNAAAGPIIGSTAVQLLADHDDAWDELVADVARWAAVWRDRGVAAALRTAMVECDTAPRLLAQRRGERAVTNLVHLTELLHVEETTSARGPESLRAWLDGQRRRPDRRADAVELRLEDDAQAVQIVTVHRAKGLQYPVVWCPFLWDGAVDR